jgi:hypothetical protein
MWSPVVAADKHIESICRRPEDPDERLQNPDEEDLRATQWAQRP